MRVSGRGDLSGKALGRERRKRENRKQRWGKSHYNKGIYVTVLPRAAQWVPKPTSALRLPTELQDLQNQIRCGSMLELSTQTLCNSLKISIIPQVLLHPNPQKILNLPLRTAQNYTKLSGKQAQIPLFLFYLLLWNCSRVPLCFLLPWQPKCATFGSVQVESEAWAHYPNMVRPPFRRPWLSTSRSFEFR